MSDNDGDVTKRLVELAEQNIQGLTDNERIQANGRVLSEDEIQYSHDHLSEFLAQGGLSSMEETMAKNGLELIATIRDRDKTIALQAAEIERLQNLGGDLVVDKADLKMKNRLMLSALERMKELVEYREYAEGEIIDQIDHKLVNTIAYVKGGST